MTTQTFARFKPATKSFPEEVKIYRVGRDDVGVWEVITCLIPRHVGRAAAEIEDAFLFADRKYRRFFTRKADAQENLNAWRKHAAASGFVEEIAY